MILYYRSIISIKTYTQWIEHGWWITARMVDNTMLWITEGPIKDNRSWSPLANKFGKLEYITTRPSDVMFIHVIIEEEEKVKYKMQRNWIMAPIPSVLVDIPSPKRVLPALKRHWASMLIEIQTAQNAAVQRFLTFTPPKILRARHFINATLAYEEMQTTDPESVQDRTPPCKPEETNPMYRILAAPLTVNWIPVHEQGRARAPTREGEDTV